MDLQKEIMINKTDRIRNMGIVYILGLAWLPVSLALITNKKNPDSLTI